MAKRNAVFIYGDSHSNTFARAEKAIAKEISNLDFYIRFLPPRKINDFNIWNRFDTKNFGEL